MTHIPGDEQLIQSILDGETNRFVELVDRYKNLGFTLAIRVLHQKEEAEEALQDAFLKAYRNLSSFRKESGFQTWFYKIVYNTCLTRLARKQLAVSTLDEIQDLIPDPAPGADREMEEKDLLAMIRKFAGQLPNPYCLLFTLFYQNEQSYDEICRITGLPLPTVKIRLNRLRGILKDRVTRFLVEEEYPV